MITHLRKAYRQFNKGLFDNSLPSVKFVFNRHRKQAFHFRSPDVIDIGVGCLGLTRSGFLDGLLHVMVHIQNWEKGLVDVTRNQYHRLEFCNAALDVGLIVSCHSTHGWGVTTTSKSVLSTDKLRRPKRSVIRRRCEVYRAIEISTMDVDKFQEEMEMDLASHPAKQFQFKYVCECDVIVRVGRKPDGPKPFQAKCLYCNTKFVLDCGRSV